MLGMYYLRLRTNYWMCSGGSLSFGLWESRVQPHTGALNFHLSKQPRRYGSVNFVPRKDLSLGFFPGLKVKGVVSGTRLQVGLD